MDLLEELKKLSLKLNQVGIDYALCRGLALAIYAKPRATLDIDIMIDADFLLITTTVAHELGFTMTSAPMEFQEGAIIIHRLIKIDKDSGEHFVLDLLITTPQTKKLLDDRLTVEWEGGLLKVLSPKSLILLKSFRNSGQDQDDIEYLRSLEDED